MKKGVAYLFRYLEVSRPANYRYLEALAVVDDPTPPMQQPDDITTRKRTGSGRGVRAFNSLSRDDIQRFKAVMGGHHHIRGLSNSDIRPSLEESHIYGISSLIPRSKARRSAES